MPERQLHFEDVAVGDRLPDLTLPLPVYRLVMAAGGTRDFTAIHHNDSYARSVGAPSMYANAGLLLGMWERALRDYIGDAGTILAIRDFRMVRFTTVGSLVTVEGRVVAKECRDGVPLVTIELRTLVGDIVTVGPGLAEVTLPTPDASA
jgi:acyl dehydratase